jgi:hypothetical protein
MPDYTPTRRRFHFKMRRALWLVRQALSYDIASGLKRPRFQFSLRTMLVVVTVVALLCPLGVWLVHQWQARTPWLLALVSIGIPVVAIVGLSLVICKTTSSIIGDRERMAKIENDIEPASSPPNDPTPPSAIQP